MTRRTSPLPQTLFHIFHPSIIESYDCRVTEHAEVMTSLCPICFLFELLCTGHSSRWGGRSGVCTFDLFQAKLTFSFGFEKCFPQRIVTGIFRKSVQFFHWTAEAFRPKAKSQTFPLVGHWSLIMTHIPLQLSPTASPVQSGLFQFLLTAASAWQCSQGLRLSNRDCACLRLSQSFQVGSYPSWAIQPSILALYRQPIGQNSMSGGETNQWLCFLFLPDLCQRRCGLPSLQNKHLMVMQYGSRDLIPFFFARSQSIVQEDLLAKCALTKFCLWME